MTLQQCRYLTEVAKYHSISRAAKELFVTQPSISKAIHELEKDLDITILDRSNRGVSFTKEGLELLPYARMLVEQEETVRYHFDREKRSHRFRLSISSQHFNFVPEAVVRQLGCLENRAYEFSFLEGKTSDVIEQVAAGLSEVGVVCVSSRNRAYLERDFVERSLVFTTIATLVPHVFLNRRHPLSSCTCLHPDQLAGYPCITYRKDDLFMNLTEDDFHVRNASRVVFVQDRGTMNELLIHTDGYNLGTGCLSGGFVSSEIRAIPLEVPWQVHVGYVKRSNQIFSEDVFRFIGFLTEAVRAALPKEGCLEREKERDRWN